MSFLTLFDLYRSFNLTHPLLGAIFTGIIIFPLADIISQLILDKKVYWNKVRYSLGLSPFYGAYGLLAVGSGWLVGKYISSHPLAMAALGPNLIGNIFNLIFFVNNNVGQKYNYHFPALGSYYRNLAAGKEKFFTYISGKEYLNAVIGTLTFWNGIQYINYTQVPVELQTPFVLAVSFAWIIVLSLWSLISRRKLLAATKTGSRETGS